MSRIPDQANKAQDSRPKTKDTSHKTEEIRIQDLGCLKAAILCGGVGQERTVSLESGKYVYESLLKVGISCVLADIRPEELEILDDQSINVFFLALHGQFGEDGTLQQILDEGQLVYTGSGPAACRIAFDKMESKKYFIEAGVDVPQAVLFKGGGSVLKLQGQLPGPIEKYVIKPLRQGSSVGVSIVEGEKRAVETAKRCEEEFGDCMVEQYIAGRELTAGVLCGSCLPIIEIKPKEKFYNYHAKYVDEKTQFLFDTIEDKKIIRQIEAKALKSFEVMGLRDFARFDFILSDDGRIFALEVNAIPGLTGHSLLPMAAKKAGISMSQLCTRVIESAVERSNCRTQDASQKDGGQEAKSGRR